MGLSGSGSGSSDGRLLSTVRMVPGSRSRPVRSKCCRPALSRLISVLIGTALILAVGAVPAFAVTVQRTDYGTVVLGRESTDGTGAVTGRTYYDYKGSQTGWGWDPAINPPYTTSFNTYWNHGTVMGGSASWCEIPLHSSYRHQLVYWSIAGGSSGLCPIINASVPVTGSVSATVTSAPAVTVAGGSLDASVTTMPAVALDSSISVDGTLPVRVAELGVLGGSDLANVLLLGLGILGVTLGISFRRRGR